MQLSLLDLSGKETSSKVNFDWLDINSVIPSNDNPRLSLNQEVIEGLVSVLKDSGWATVSPIAARKIGNGYEVVDGHHRLEAAKQAGATQVLCNVLEMTDEEAVIQRWVLNNQTEFNDIEKCLYFYRHTKKDSKLGLSRAEFAKRLEKNKQTGLRWANAGEVAEQCHIDVTLLVGKTTHLSCIAQSPQQYWQQLTELLIENEWSVKQTEAIVDAIKSIDIPEHLQFWLDPDDAIKTTISECLSGGEVRTPRDIKNWVTAVDECLAMLPEKREIKVVDHEYDTQEIHYHNLQVDFLDKLPELSQGAKKPSVKKINAIAEELLNWAKSMDKAHAQWVAERADNEEKQRRLEAEKQEALAKRQKFSPDGINAPIQTLDARVLGSNFDAIITDVPYLLSNGGTTVRSGKEVTVNKNFADTKGEAVEPSEYMPLFFELLKPGGFFITTCTQHTHFDLLCSGFEAGFELRETAIWYKRNSPPLLSADRLQPQYEFVLVFLKPGATPYFGHEDIKLPGDKQRGNVIDIPQCSGKERDHGHDTQKPLELYELLVKAYCPPEGVVLEPFAGSGTTAVACKKLGRLCTWVEQDPTFFSRAEQRILESPFHWEV